VVAQAEICRRTSPAHRLQLVNGQAARLQPVVALAQGLVPVRDLVVRAAFHRVRLRLRRNCWCLCWTAKHRFQTRNNKIFVTLT
jgi:hypothetical protein